MGIGGGGGFSRVLMVNIPRPKEHGGGDEKGKVTVVCLVCG